ncbi:MAG: glycoside hydrolase family 3 C-terminal domain-containing protein [Bacteroidota bacterium]
MKIYKLSFITGILLVMTFFPGCRNHEPNEEQSQAMDLRIEELLNRLSLDQKLILLQGDGMATIPIESFDIPSMACSDGPFGAHRGSKITAFPCGNSLGASWDTLLLGQVAGAIAREAKEKNIQCLLGPGVNIIRQPLCGRNFEYYSEDPFLTARLAVAFTRGLQDEKVAATLKHFAVNNQEFYRNTINVEVDERTLREIYLPGFKAAVMEAGAWSVMTAYNKINGAHCSENNHLLNDILKKEWGFRGFVMPDWAGAHSTIASANAGLDCIIYDGDLFGKPLAEAVESGEVPEERINDMARRVLRTIYLTGLMDQEIRSETIHTNSAKHRELNRKAAREGIVLLKNENSILPIKKERVKKLAIVGPNAAKLRLGGGGSSFVNNVFYQVSPMEGIMNAAGKDFEIEFSQGVGIPDTLIIIEPKYLKPAKAQMGKGGLRAEYFNNMELKGKPVAEQIDSTIDFSWQEGPSIYLSDAEKSAGSTFSKTDQLIGKDSFSVRWTGIILPPETGYYDFVTRSDDGVRLSVNGKMIIDQWFSHDREYRYGTIWLEEKKEYDIRLEYYEEIGGATMSLGWYYHNSKEFNDAVSLAEASDAVIIYAGLDRFWEAEGADRTDFELPRVQTELIQAIARVNPNVIVVLNNGGPINVRPWINNVPGLVEAWFTGNEGGNAIADVLFGKYSPSGKLPFSYVQNESEFPPAFDNYLNRDKIAEYREGLYVGYRYHDRYKTPVMFPFGFGLSYTTFDYKNIAVKTLTEMQIRVSVELVNSGNVDGAEVVQLYIKPENSKVERPEKELKAFARVELKAGESKIVQLNLNRESFSYFDTQQNKWTVQPGNYQILVGASSTDIRQKKDFKLTYISNISRDPA